jgi:hypothetical protein
VVVTCGAPAISPLGVLVKPDGQMLACGNASDCVPSLEFETMTDVTMRFHPHHSTLNPQPYNLNLNPQPSTLNTQHSTLNP